MVILLWVAVASAELLFIFKDVPRLLLGRATVTSSDQIEIL